MDTGTKLSTCAAIVISIGTAIGSALSWLNSNAAAVGILLGIMTTISTLILQRKQGKAHDRVLNAKYICKSCRQIHNRQDD